MDFFRRMLWLFVLTLLKGREGNGVDVYTSCLEYFQGGQVNIITCSVNQTSISEVQCAVPPTSIVFQLISSSGSLADICSIVYPPTSCAPQTTAPACICAEQMGDVVIYQWNFVADQTYAGANVSCKICDLFVGTGPLRVISPSCSRILIATKTTATTTITTTTTTFELLQET